MRWQKAAQFTIALFVLIFIGVLAVSMRRQKPAPEQGPPVPVLPDKQAQVYNPEGGRQSWYSGGRKVFDVQFGKHVGLADGRQLLSGGVRIVSNRNGKDLTITATEAEVKAKGTEFESAVLKGDVSLSGEGGIEVKTSDATYTEADGMVKMPGAVAFRKARLRGTGVGATYDMNREVLWLLDQATFNVAADKDGKGAMEGRAGSIGLARLEHYVRLVKDGQITGEGRDIRADEITITLSADDERVQMLQLRGNSRMTGGAGGPQSMSAKDIDVIYGEDGRTLQTANLMEQALLQLAPPAGSGPESAAGKRITGRTINLGLAPDGKTVTHLTASENVQVDLPEEGNGSAKRIRSAALVASGAPEAGLQSATFTGKVEYRETRAARRNVPAAERTANSESLSIETKPGLGAIQKADFRGNVSFRETDLLAEAPRGIYYLERDRVELMPSDGDPGKPPRVTDGKIDVGARTIAFTLGTRELLAETKVRSTLAGKAGGRGQQTKVPSVLKQGEPVNVTSNRLHYQGAASKAVYSGSVIMWQEETSATAKGETMATIKGETITLDDKTGNLEADGNVITDFLLDDTDAKTKEKKRTRAIGKAQHFVFYDKQRLATYRGKAQFDGAQGNLTGERIQVFLKAGANQVDRLEAFAEGGLVTAKEGTRTVTGIHLTYTAENETYLMVGTPVTGIEDIGGGTCRVLTGGSLQFQRGAETGEMKGVGNVPSETNNRPCASLKR